MNLGISYIKSNRSSCDYQVKKVLTSVKQNMFSQC